MSALDEHARLARLTTWAMPGTNALLGLVFAVVLAAQAYRIAAAGGRGWLFDLCVGVVVCGAALVRRGDRTVAAVVGLSVTAAGAVVAWLGHLPGEPGVAASLALIVLMGSSVRALPAHRAALIAGAALPVMALGLLLAVPSTATAPTPSQLGLIGWFAGLVLGLLARFLDERRRGDIENIRRDERLALARELHDVVAHHVSGIVVQTQAARIVGRKRPEALDDTLAGIERSGTDALDAMRRVVALLRDTEDGAASSPGTEQLTELVRRFEGHGPAVDLRLAEPTASWPPEVTTTVYRVVQESLTNIARHARHAGAATVTVSQAHDGLTVAVDDDAPHTPSRHTPRGGYGLIGMRERVEALGGTLDAGPRPGAGWSVRATLPLAPGARR
ncbi:sensor histidine kinase [Streptomyces sp. NPDC101152]|uniref:sensor histidine kinase n=1 Tax=Streptomyces sp. NPDC101152 TaxID=3366116 RepID=UPI00380E4DB8